MASKLFQAITGAFFWLCTCLVVGAACVVAGVYLLAGPGAAVLAAGMLLLGFGRIIFRGIAHE